jgi:hypothetical protein
MRSHLKNSIAYLLTLSFLFMQMAPAYAGMIDTQTLVDEAGAKVDRERLVNALERDQVRSLLARHGVTEVQMRARIDALTEEEISQLAAHFEDKPGGGVIEVLIIAALVVVILELVGITDIFTRF